MAFLTVSPLSTTYGWHGAVYPAGCTFIPEELAIALGLKSPDPGPQNTQKGTELNSNFGYHGTQKVTQSVALSAALSLINSATAASALEVLPGIGPANANRIFQARPQGGYESLEAVALVPDLSNAIDWDEIEAWEFSEE